MSRRALLLSALLAQGCGLESVTYKAYPGNPYPDIRHVVVLPFMNRTLDPQANFVEFSNIFASELLKFEGFRVVRPLQAAEAAAPGEKIQSLEDVLRFARRFKADAIVVADVTDYDPYDPPRIGISVQFLRTSARGLAAAEIDRIVQSSSWRRGPVGLSRDKAGHFIAAFEHVYDAHEERIRREIVAYAQAQDESDSPFPAEREFLAVQARYQQFVSNQVINHIFEVSAPHAP